MLNKKLIIAAIAEARQERGLSQKEMGALLKMNEQGISNTIKRTDQPFSLLWLQQVADAIGTDVERMVVPGLTDAKKYMHLSGNISIRDITGGQSTQGHGTSPHMHNFPSKDNDDLNKKLYDCQESRIKLLEEITRLKDEINTLENELKDCRKGA